MKGKVGRCVIGLAGYVICAAAWALVIHSRPTMVAKGGNGEGAGGGVEETPEEFGCVELLDAHGDGIRSDGLLDAGENDPYDYCHEGRPLVVVLGDSFIFKVKARAKRQLHVDLGGMACIDEGGNLTGTPFQFPPVPCLKETLPMPFLPNLLSAAFQV